MKYTNAPIIEAIIDIQVELPESVTLDTLKKVCEKHSAHYSELSPISRNTAELLIPVNAGKEESSFKTEQKEVGWACKNESDQKIYQVRLDGFTCNKLPPYADWEDFRDIACSMWSVYKEQTKPERIKRVALRYINRIDIPLPITDLKDYLVSAPDIPKGLPQGVDSFFSQIRLPLPSVQCMALLTHATTASDTEGVASIILDIDVSFDNASQLSEADTDIWSIFETLRAQKNMIFENCITDQTRRLFE